MPAWLGTTPRRCWTSWPRRCAHAAERSPAWGSPGFYVTGDDRQFRGSAAVEVLLDDFPAGKVVLRVREGVVLVGGGRRELRLSGVLPPLAQVPREPRQLPRQRRHRAPQLGQRHVVVRREPGPQL